MRWELTNMTDDIILTLSDYISQNVLKKPGRKIQANEPLLSSGLVDSFHLVDIGLFVEDTFNVRIEDFELNAETFDTLAQLAALILDRQD